MDSLLGNPWQCLLAFNPVNKNFLMKYSAFGYIFAPTEELLCTWLVAPVGRLTCFLVAFRKDNVLKGLW